MFLGLMPDHWGTRGIVGKAGKVVLVVWENFCNQASFFEPTRMIAHLILHIALVCHLQRREGVAVFPLRFVVMAKSLLQARSLWCSNSLHKRWREKEPIGVGIMSLTGLPNRSMMGCPSNGTRRVPVR